MDATPFVGPVIARAAFQAPAAGSVPALQRATAAARPVTVFVDRSPAAENAAWRGALVARDRGLPLHLIALQPLHADLAQAAAFAESLASQLRDRMGLQVSSQTLAGTPQHEGVEAAREASLLVLPVAARGRARLLGSPVLPMLRRARRPVLLVRMPAQASYRGVLAAVELGRQACSLIAAAQALSRGPRIRLLHVLDAVHEEAMRLADVPERIIHAQRGRDALRARGVLADLAASAGARDEVESLIAFGNAADAVMQQQLDAGVELLVVGKRPRPAWRDALRANVADRVLRGAAADVLVLPLPPLGPEEPWHLPDFARPAP